MARLLKLAAIWFVISLLAQHGTDFLYGARLAGLREADRARTRELEKGAASAESARRMEAHLATTELRKTHEENLAKSWGSGAAAAGKDFRLSLTEMLIAITRDVAPAGSNVEVSVDRFTDFGVNVELASELPLDELTRMTSRILELSSPYLHRLSFFANRRLIGEIDPLSIGAAQRDEIPSFDAIKRALVANVRDEPKPPPIALGPGQTEEHHSDATEPFDRVVSEWSDGYGAHFAELSEIMKRLGDAAGLRTVKTRGDLSICIKSVDAARDEVVKLEKYFRGCLKELNEKLAPTADPLATSIMMRETTARYSAPIKQGEALCRELTAFQSSVRRLLQTLDSPVAGWRIEDRGILFENQATLTTFNLRNAEVASELKKVQAAAQALSAAAK